MKVNGTIATACQSECCADPDLMATGHWCQNECCYEPERSFWYWTKVVLGSIALTAFCVLACIGAIVVFFAWMALNQ